MIEMMDDDVFILNNSNKCNTIIVNFFSIIMIEMMDDDVFYFEWCCSSVLFVVHHQKEERTAPVAWPESSTCNHPLISLMKKRCTKPKLQQQREREAFSLIRRC